MKILALSGFIPEQICDTIRFIQYPGGRGISHYCGYVSDFIARVIDDDSVDGAVFPKSCDSCRVIGSYCAQSGKFLYQLHIPSRRDDAAVQYLAAGIKSWKEAVERNYKITIDDIVQRSERINLRNREIRRMYECVEEICYSDYLESLHQMLAIPLYEQKVPAARTEKNKNGKKVFLIGPFLSDLKIVRAMEDAGLNIAGDNLTESQRLFSAAPVQTDATNIYESIAYSILHNRVSPTQNHFADILTNDLQEIRQKDIRGVIYISQKYCEPYDYLFSVYKKMLDEYKIPVLKLQTSESAKHQNMELAIEAFADIL